MRVGRKVTLAAFGSLGLVALTASCNLAQQPASGAAQSAHTAQSCGADTTNLVGTWKLTMINGDPNNHVVGADPQGILILDAACNIAFQLMGHRDPHTSSTQRGNGAPSEDQTDAKGTIAYFGKYVYTVDPTGSGTLSITPTRHSFPNLEDTFTRTVTYMAGSTAKLVYTNSSPSTGVQNSGLVFSRQ